MAQRPRFHAVNVGQPFHVSPELASLAAIAAAIVLLFVAAALMSALAPWR